MLSLQVVSVVTNGVSVHVVSGVYVVGGGSSVQVSGYGAEVERPGTEDEVVSGGTPCPLWVSSVLDALDDSGIDAVGPADMVELGMGYDAVPELVIDRLTEDSCPVVSPGVVVETAVELKLILISVGDWLEDPDGSTGDAVVPDTVDEETDVSLGPEGELVADPETAVLFDRGNGTELKEV